MAAGGPHVLDAFPALSRTPRPCVTSGLVLEVETHRAGRVPGKMSPSPVEPRAEVRRRVDRPRCRSSPRGPPVVVVNGAEQWGPYAWIVARARRCPLLIDVHGDVLAMAGRSRSRPS